MEGMPSTSNCKASTACDESSVDCEQAKQQITDEVYY
jgi:hypothetical protein